MCKWFKGVSPVALGCSDRLRLQSSPRHGDRRRYLQLRDGVLVEQALLRRVPVKLGDRLGALHLNIRALLVEFHHAAGRFPRMLQSRACAHCYSFTVREESTYTVRESSPDALKTS
jgi:hypothetical protein